MSQNHDIYGIHKKSFSVVLNKLQNIFQFSVRQAFQFSAVLAGVTNDA